MSGDAGMNDTPSMQLHDHEDVNGPEEQIMNHGEITSPDILEMVLDESGPGLARFLVAIFGDILLDGALADSDPQVQQLTMESFPRFIGDPFGTPGQVFPGHLLDESDSFKRNARFSLLLGLGFPTPVTAEQIAMPTQERIWLHDVKCLLPKTGQSGQANQVHTVSLGQLWTFDLSIEYDELLS
jgi:hypothetical protein